MRKDVSYQKAGLFRPEEASKFAEKSVVERRGEEVSFIL